MKWMYNNKFLGTGGTKSLWSFLSCFLVTAAFSYLPEENVNNHLLLNKIAVYFALMYVHITIDVLSNIQYIQYILAVWVEFAQRELGKVR
jgi:hypothetical protein